jgi:thiamine-monophosphate kinase
MSSAAMIMAGQPKPGEFEIIRRYLAPLATSPGALGLTDDAALLTPPPDCELVLTVDAMVAGVHFLDDDPPDLVARKLMRVNLSDLAAMGAEPLGYLLTTAWPRELGEDWIAGFVAGLAQDQAAYRCTLLGGDTVATPGPMSLTLTAVGQVPKGRAVRRQGARRGDAVFVTGSIGDGALGLLALKGELAGLSDGDLSWLAGRYRLPEPRTAVGPALTGLAHAMLDVSDGLVADAGHLAECAGLRFEVAQARVPLSPAAARAVAARPELWASVLGGGDDYELLFTAAPGDAAGVAAVADRTGVAITEIGRVVSGAGVCVRDADGQQVTLSMPGWSHF